MPEGLRVEIALDTFDTLSDLLRQGNNSNHIKNMIKLYRAMSLTNEEIDAIVYETAKELIEQLETLTSEKGAKPC